MTARKSIQPIVSKYHVSGTRKGRGFSMGELKDAAISVHQAKVNRLPLDQRRKSTHQHNIETLKECKEKNFEL